MYAGLLMDYHLIFMIICFFLFFLSIILIWLVGTKQAVVVSIFFTGLNQLFCIITMIGFFSIGYVGYNETTGESTIIGYTEMEMFNVVFLCLLWLNAVILFVAIYKYMRIVLHEQLGSEYGYSDEFR